MLPRYFWGLPLQVIRRVVNFTRLGLLVVALICSFGFFSTGCDSAATPQNSKKLRVMALPWMFGKYPLREARQNFEKRHPGISRRRYMLASAAHTFERMKVRG